MATFVLTNVNSFVHGYDFTCDSNQVSLTPSVDVQDATTFCSAGWNVKRGGLKEIEAEIGGFWDVTPDGEAFSSLGIADRAVTIAPQGTAGTPAFMFKAGNFSYEAFGNVGDMTPFTLSMQGTDGIGLVRGQVAAARSTAVTSGAATGSAVNLGAGAAGKFVYISLHVLTAGTSLSLQLQESTTQGGTYADADVDPVTASGVGGQLTRFDASSLTGPWYRLMATATGSFTVAAAIAIQ